MQILEEFKRKDRQRTFSLSTDVLLRAAILQLQDFEYEFTWSFHHIVMDGWCTGILTLEFLEIYSALLEKRACHLPAVTPYREYIGWLESQDLETARGYWKRYLEDYDQPAGIPQRPLDLEPDKSAASLPPYQKEQVVLPLDRQQTSALHRLAGNSQVTLNTVLQAVCGKSDVVFGIVVSGRPPEIEEVESMVGLFIHTVPVRLELNRPLTFRQFLHRLHAVAIASEPHHYYPLAKIQALSPLKNWVCKYLLWKSSSKLLMIWASGSARALPSKSNSSTMLMSMTGTLSSRFPTTFTTSLDRSWQMKSSVLIA